MSKQQLSNMWLKRWKNL